VPQRHRPLHHATTLGDVDFHPLRFLFIQ
jgi:hypothetical protein